MIAVKAAMWIAAWESLTGWLYPGTRSAGISHRLGIAR